MSTTLNSFGKGTVRQGVYVLAFIISIFAFTNCDDTNSILNETDIVEEEEEDNTDEPADTTSSSDEQEFAVYDGMNIDNKPDAIADAGVKPIKVHYAASIFGISARNLNGNTDMPDKDRVVELAEQTAEAGYEHSLLDIEHWITEGDPNEVAATVERFEIIMDWVREAAPEVEWGYYGEVPIRDYWRAIEPTDSNEYQDWMQANDLLQPVTEVVDVIYPSIYTFYDDRERWEDYAKAQIDEARRLNPDKKVFVYLWPEYHMSNPHGIAGDLIEKDFWELQLELAHEHADGVVIYAQSSFNFSTSQGWWQATEEFIQELE